MPEITLIIHGWSAYSLQFENLKNYLIAQNLGTVQSIVYADYQSREDSLTFNDIVHGLNDRMIEKGFIDASGKKLCNMNVIVHSTGGLIIRHWISHYYSGRIQDCPVQKIIMLAPANFGSPLAHRGKSLLGLLTKGRREIGNFLEVGRQILDGLELGSSYQWNLAEKDLICANPYYNFEQIQVSILVGCDGYSGYQSFINKPGTDGVIVIAGAAINSAKLTLDFCKPNSSACVYHAHQWAYSTPIKDFAFGILPNLNHNTIVQNLEATGPLIEEALQIKTAKQFQKFQGKLKTISQKTYAQNPKPKYQQFIVRVVDDHNLPVNDFTLEFFIVKQKRQSQNQTLEKNKSYASQITDLEYELSRQVQNIISQEFHTYSKDSSYRRFLVNLEEVESFMLKAAQELNSQIVLSMRLHLPEIDKGIRYDTENLQNIVLYDPNIKENSLSFFYENTTTLLELKVNRCNDYVVLDYKPRKQ